MDHNQLKALRDVEKAALRIAMDALHIRHLSLHAGLTSSEALEVANGIDRDATQIKSLARALIRQLSPRGQTNSNGGGKT